MRPTVTKTIKQDILNKRKYNYKYVLCICVLFFALIVARGINDFFFYAFVGVSSVVFIMSNSGHCMSFLFFLLPLAPILKLDAKGMSFFTVLFFLVILKLTVKLHKVNIGLISALVVLALYSLVFSELSAVTTIITMLSGILLLYYLRNEKIHIDINTTVIVYSIGIILSSILAIFREMLPVIDSFITDSVAENKITESSLRFSGLHGNPNYYTLDIIVVMSAIVVLLYNNRNTKVHTFFLIALSVLGLMSVSKSFLVAWVLLMICWLLISIKQGVRKTIKFILVAMMGAVVVYYFASDYINSYIYRLMQDSSGTLESITTGRSTIWFGYVEEILSDIKILLFGNGLKTISETVGMATHNTYIELLYSLGIFGAIIFLLTLRIGMGKIKLKYGIWIPVIILMIRMFALNMLTYDNLWFYLAIILLLARETSKQNILRPNSIEDKHKSYGMNEANNIN